MLDPRIYRSGFAVVALAVVALAFSLVDPDGPLGTGLAPDAFSGQHALSLTATLAAHHPARRAGDAADGAVASSVSTRLSALGYRVSTQTFSARTVAGRRTLENVIAVRAGLTAGSIVVVSSRDMPGSPLAALSGTGVMLELGRVLAGGNEHHTIVLASTSGSGGAAGAAALVRQVPGPIDAVIVLGDLASARPRAPVLLPWSTGDALAPTMLRRTVAAALSGQANLAAGSTGLAGQLLHLALPATLGQQAPFVARGIPAVTVSLSGDRTDAAGPASGTTIESTGRAVLSAVDAIDAGPPIPRPTPYVMFSGKVIPDWAIRLLVLALLTPVLPAAVDGFARARRRGHAAELGVLRALAAAIPFVIAAGLVLVARLTHVLAAVPPGPVGGRAVPFSGAGAAVLAVAALTCLLGGWAWFRGGGPVPRREDGSEQGDGVGTLLALWGVAAATWVINPYAAILTLPAVHLWMWLLDDELRPRRTLAALLWLAGLALPVLAAVGYARALGLGPFELVWNGVLLLGGGGLSPALAVVWCLLAGCTLAVGAAALAAARAPRPEAAPVTVRGPITYAGPGSLGGTESALRR